MLRGVFKNRQRGGKIGMKNNTENSSKNNGKIIGVKRRSAVKIMGELIVLVKPLIHIMLLAIILGTLGYLCAIFLTVIAGQVILTGLKDKGADIVLNLNNTIFSGASSKGLFISMLVIAVMRGVLHYAEQYCNHFIAFKLLSIIRHKVFAALRKLCPAKLEGRDKGNLISIITTDIELLEVFYAHTISPIAIAVLTCVIMVIFFSIYNVYAGVLAVLAYIFVGVVIPLWNGKRGQDTGMEFRNKFGELNSFVLDSLRGLDETIQYGRGADRSREMEEKSKELGGLQGALIKNEGRQRAVTNLTILVFSFAMLFLMVGLYQKGETGFEAVVTCTVAMMGSFGPVVALSGLSNNLNHTLASGERVLSLLEEKPLVEEIDEENYKNEDTVNRKAGNGIGAALSDVTFAYNEENILESFSFKIEKGQIVGIHGPSGCGKSTMLKLLMRFWDVKYGKVLVAERDVKNIPTRRLRDMESFVTQDTHLFHDSILNNIAIGNLEAGREEIIEAAKKASIHDFIMTLPKGYDTMVGELGDTLSGGEKQRIGIARAFLHDAPFILLDEPTSNLDSLNEGVILKALSESCEDKTVILVSHRKSTMSVADVVYEMRSGRVS